MGGGHSYAEAGVDIEADNEAIASIEEWLNRTLSFRRENVFEDVKGHYSGLYRLEDGRVLAMSTDGVGTKIMVAAMLKKYDTLGIDLMGMLANDIVSVGSTPIAMVDYIAVDKPQPDLLSEIGKGIYEGCRQANVVALGGETATMPDLVTGFDLAGAIVGISEETDLVLGSDIEEGDAVVGIASDGMHSNGYSLARKVLFEWNDYSVHDQLPTDQSRTIGEALMTPTRIYVKVVLDIARRAHPHGLAHITGGGLTKLRRLRKDIGYVIDRTFPVKPIFSAVRKLGSISWEEMYRTYNMGVGFAVVCGQEDVEDVLGICDKHSLEARVIGSAVNDPDRRIEVRAQERFSI